MTDSILARTFFWKDGDNVDIQLVPVSMGGKRFRGPMVKGRLNAGRICRLKQAMIYGMIEKPSLDRLYLKINDFIPIE